MRPYLVGIAGASCSGKTSACEIIAKRYNDALIVHLDDYWKAPENFPRIGMWENWELPQNLHLDAFANDLAQLKVGRTIVGPRWVHKSDVDRSTTRELVPTPMIFAEGFVLFNDERICDLFDLRFFLEIPDEVIVDRRMRRMRSGRAGREMYYRTVVVPQYRTYGAPNRARAHRIIDGSQSHENVVRAIEREIVSHR